MISDVGFVLRTVASLTNGGNYGTSALDCKVSKSLLQSRSIIAFDTKLKVNFHNFYLPLQTITRVKHLHEEQWLHT